MNSQRRRLFQGSLWFFAPLAWSENAVAESNAEAYAAFKEAAEIKAEAQRFAKLHVERVLSIHEAKAARLQGATATELQSLASSLSKRKISSIQSNSAALLANVRELIEFAPPDLGRSKLVELSTRCDRTTELSEQILAILNTQTPALKPIGLTARALYLVQRLSRNYYLAAAGLIQNKGVDQSARDRHEVSAVLEQLSSLPLNSASIRHNLELTKNQWTVANSALQVTKGERQAEDVARTSEHMFESLDDLMHEYHKIIATLFT